MVREMLKSKIHRATVTEARVEYVGSITIDSELMELADITPYEKVLVADIDNGARLETYAIEGPPGSGVVCMNGAAARLVEKGDKVIIMTFASYEDSRGAHAPSARHLRRRRQSPRSRKGRLRLSSDAAPGSDRAALTTALDRVIATALVEDLGSMGAEADITTVSTVPADTLSEGTVIAKQHGVIAGLEALSVAFGQLDDRVEVELLKRDGNIVQPGDKLATVRGPARAILAGERTALNLLSHLSGIATLANAFVQRAPEAKIVETRKTLPGLRALEKYAVTCGGATNHRFSLWDGVLIKDNHIVAAGGVGEAVRRAKKATTLPVQVECATRDDVLEAIGAGAPSLLLDNRTPDELLKLVGLIRERAPGTLIEASGGVTLDNVDAIAATGVDRISIGAFTHSAPALDVSLNLDRVWSE